MYSSLKAAAAFPFLAAVCFLTPIATHAQGVPSIRRVQVLRSGGRVEIEIEASERIVPQINLLRGPDRLVVDFVNARPSAELRNIAVNRTEVKNLRVGLFSTDPPVTRVVLDLNGPQPYQVFPSGKTVIVKIGGSSGSESAALHSSSGPVLVNHSLSRRSRGDPRASAACREPAPGSFFQQRAAFDQLQQGQSFGNPLRSPSAHRSRDRHPCWC